MGITSSNILSNTYYMEIGTLIPDTFCTIALMTRLNTGDIIYLYYLKYYQLLKI